MNTSILVSVDELGLADGLTIMTGAQANKSPAGRTTNESSLTSLLGLDPKKWRVHWEKKIKSKLNQN